MAISYITSAADESGIDPRVVAYYKPESTIVEQYRNLRTYLGSLNGGNLFRSVMVTSANDGEGKSITSANLAVTMAEDKKKSILLVSADFRSPAIENLFNVQAEKGLSDYFNGEVRLDQILTATNIKNLMVLPSGNIPSNPAEFFASQKMSEFIKELEKHFNYIILDTPALIPFADARILGPVVDGVVLVVQAGKTRREVIWRAQDLLKSVRAKLLGVILSHVEYYIPEYIHRHL